MPKSAKKKASYEDLCRIPENMTGEIIDGELIVTRQPPRSHVYTVSTLDKEIGPPYQLGQGGPGGWIILVRPEIMLQGNIMVPDLAGWRKERFPQHEGQNSISVAPNWVCEVHSPWTVQVDKIRKMPLYARHSVEHVWLIDRIARMMDVFRLEAGRWFLLGSFAGKNNVRVEPFQEIEIALGDLWIENLQPQTD
jgi:Uma2 family endonuclease